MAEAKRKAASEKVPLLCVVTAIGDDFTGWDARRDKNLIWISASAMLSRAKPSRPSGKTKARLH
jgi:hypothetical protein